MIYSVIYEVDVAKGVNLTRFVPKWNKRWTRTETGESEWMEGGRHRKYCGIISQAELDDLVDRACLMPSEVETMGSIGAPGFGLGWAPAISFEQYTVDDDAYTSAYVTPIVGIDDPCAETWPEGPATEEEAHDAWDKAKQYILDRYK